MTKIFAALPKVLSELRTRVPIAGGQTGGNQPEFLTFFPESNVNEEIGNEMAFFDRGARAV